MSFNTGGMELYCEKCGCLMKLRTGKYGEFFGCTGYPTCQATMNLRNAEHQIKAQLGVDWDDYDELADSGHPGNPRFYGDN